MNKPMRFSKKIARYINRQVMRMTGDEIRNTLLETNGLNQSNCWWVEYHLRDALVEVIENELDCRQDGSRGSLIEVQGDDPKEVIGMEIEY